MAWDEMVALGFPFSFPNKSLGDTPLLRIEKLHAILSEHIGAQNVPDEDKIKLNLDTDEYILAINCKSKNSTSQYQLDIWELIDDDCLFSRKVFQSMKNYSGNHLNVFLAAIRFRSPQGKSLELVNRVLEESISQIQHALQDIPDIHSEYVVGIWSDTDA